MESKDVKNSPSLDTVSELLDKLALIQLHLMEVKMNQGIMIESKIRQGTIHLAKSRYIMGQTSVSTAQLPTESSQEFSAIVHTESSDGKQFQVVENNGENTVNPLRWFGILVPQNMHKAQHIFQSSIRYIVECANIQYEIYENMKNIDMVKRYKQFLKSE